MHFGAVKSIKNALKLYFLTYYLKLGHVPAEIMMKNSELAHIVPMLLGWLVKSHIC